MVRHYLPIAFAALAQPLSAAVLFQENFNVDHAIGDPIPTTNSSLDLVRWNGHTGYTGSPGAIADDSPGNTSSHRLGVLNGPAAPTGIGYLFFQNSDSATAGTDYFAYTSTSLNSEFPNILPSSHTSLTMSWVQTTTSFSTGAYHVTIEVNGAWYVSEANQRGSGTARSFDLLTATWKNLELVTGSGGSLGIGANSSTSAELFTGGNAITGIGFYVDNLPVPATGATTTLRIDSLQIATIPEPSVSALGLLGAGILFRRSRRK